VRFIDRLYLYLEFKSITPYTFERTCGIANGYLKKQYNGKGSVGSEIVEKIYKHYPDLNPLWLLTGEGDMIIRDLDVILKDEEKKYMSIKDEMIALLQNQVAFLEKSIADKEKIIAMLETQLNTNKKAK
jgi:hypothetical protein